MSILGGGLIIAPVVAHDAWADAMTVLRVIADPEATKAHLEALIAALADNEATLQRCAEEIAAKQDAREVALRSREEAVKQGEARLAARIAEINKALGM